MTRGEIFWADLEPPVGRRPVCVLTRTRAASVLTGIVCAPITRTIRGIRSEVSVGPVQGLPEESVINCDTVITVAKDQLGDKSVGRLDLRTTIQLDEALRYALEIRW
ncbi:MAG: type II toxin-antitoxin system PemK/MazF family toxin [Actinomycetota bacterium]|nr:type II toxin-antitoxin system PemK/MazF family toxin [Actinomycetota bacterium]